MNILPQKTTENLFEPLNLSKLTFDFKLVPLDIKSIPQEEELYFREIHKAVKLLSSKIGGPATLYRKDGKQYIAIPADLTFEDFVIHSKPASVWLKLLPEVYHVRFENCDDQEFEIICRLLDFSIRQQVKKSGKVIEEGTGRFIFKQPLKGYENNSIDLLHGFKFRLLSESKEKVSVCLDVTYRFLDKYSLGHHTLGKDLKSAKKILLGNHTNSKSGVRYLYKMGDSWFPIEVFSFSDNVAKNELITDKNTGETMSLYDYLVNKTKNHRNNLCNRIKPDDLVVYYKYPGREMEFVSAPVSLIHRIYKSDDKKIGKLQRETIKETSDRFRFVEENIKNEFLHLTYNGQELKVFEKPFDSNLKAFALKDLKYNSNQIVRGLMTKNGSIILNENYARQRKATLQSVGVLNKGTLDDTQYLLIPDALNFPRGLQNTFREHFEQKAHQLCPEFNSFKKIITYPSNKESVTDLVEEVAKVLTKEGILSGYALIILPYWGSDDKSVGLFHDFVKHHFKGHINFQCANGDKIRSFFEQKGQGKFEFVDEDCAKKFNPYLFNLVLEYLKLNERYPYLLKDNPNYDVYIGVDVHQRFAAFSFFYRNGEHIKIQHIEIPKPPTKSRYERLTSKQIYDVIYPTLKRQLPRYCKNPNGIVMVRDGRSCESETIALNQTIKQLHADNIIEDAQIPNAVVDLHKRSQVPYRVGSRDSIQKQYDIPLAGTYRILGRSNEQAFLFPTGFPFRIKGSAKPLHFTLISQENDIVFEKIIEDMFGQCLLAFSAPDLPNSLPIIIKLLDDFLEPFGYSQTRLDDAMKEQILSQAEEEYEDHVDAWSDDNFQQINI
jgi:hypothetical protein